MLKSTKQWWWFLASSWLVLNIIQATFTELANDEAYYWTYAQALDWGYFDHPPMVALWIAAGDWIPGELGVRILTILSELGLLAILFFGILDPIHREKDKLIALFAFAFFLPLMQLYGFISTPDAPLIFFTALFLWSYKIFLSQKSWTSVLFLGLSMAAMLYSKYHGVLVIGFTLLSNLALLKNPRFYAASLFGALCYTPHLYWQFTHDFPSFQYHLVDRNDPFRMWYFWEYVINIFVVYNPFLWYLYFKVFRKINWKDPLVRASGFIVFGTLCFFLLSLRRGHVQPQWTIIICIPLLIILCRYYYEHPAWTKKYLKRTAWVYLPLILLIRFVLAIDVLPIQSEFQGKSSWAKAIRKALPEQHILFYNSFQKASAFRFYDGQEPCGTIRDHHGRRNQYELWEWEEKYRGKSVFVEEREQSGTEWISLPNNRRMYGKISNNFQPLSKVQIKTQVDHFQWERGTTQKLRLSLWNPYSFPVIIGPDTESAVICYLIDGDDEYLLTPEFEAQHLTLAPGQRNTIEGQIKAPERIGRFELSVQLKFRSIALPSYEKKALIIE